MKFYCVLFHYFILVYIVYAYKAVKTQKDGEVSAIMEEKRNLKHLFHNSIIKKLKIKSFKTKGNNFEYYF